LCAELASERGLVDEVHERAASVDLDDRQPLPVASLELVVTRDVDLSEVEPQLVAEARDLVARAVAEVATLGVVDDDAPALYG
jgi:hypothetical protein